MPSSATRIHDDCWKKNITQTIISFQIEICKSQNTTGWLCALYAYKGLLLIVGVYMAWETRNVKISALNDSKYIGISVYSVVITSASVVVIGTIISERATLAYITITSLILITTTSTLCLLFLPKIIAIRKNKSKYTEVIIGHSTNLHLGLVVSVQKLLIYISETTLH